MTLPHWRLLRATRSLRGEHGDPTLPSRKVRPESGWASSSFLVMVGSREWLGCLKGSSWVLGFVFSLLALEMLARAASEARRKRSTVMTGGEGQPASGPWEPHPSQWWQRVLQHWWLVQFLLSIPGSKKNNA